MHRITSRRLSPTTVIPLIALFVALGGTSYAAATKLFPKNSVGSAQVVNGSLQKIDLSKKTIASLKGLRGVQGPQGAAGAQGLKGDKGDVGSLSWAQVNPNGGSPLLVATNGFVSVSSPNTGVYCLHAAAGINLANSAPVATQETNLSSTLGLVTVRRSGIPNPLCAVNDLQVTTWDASNPSSLTTVNTVGFDVVVP